MEVQVKRAFKSFFGKKNNTKAEPASNFLQPLVQDSLFYNEHPFISPPLHHFSKETSQLQGQINKI